MTSSDRSLLLILAFCVAFSAAAQEDPFVIDRDVVARATGDELLQSSGSFPRPDAGPGLVFAQIFRPQTGEPFISIGVRVISPGVPGQWRIEVRDLRDKLLTEMGKTKPAEAEEWKKDAPVRDDPDVLWSPTFPQQPHVRLLVYAEAASAAPKMQLYGFSVVKLVRRTEAIPDKNDQLQEFTGFGDPVRSWGASVARIKFDGINGRRYHCTGFLLASDLLMTNYHCIKFSEEQEKAVVEFDANTAAATPVSRRLSSLADRSKELDMAIFRLSSALTDRAPLCLSSERVSQSQNLVIVQHPDGRHKKVSKDNCLVDGIALVGWVKTAGKTDFGHSCDTHDGSSGSPVQNFPTGMVVGLHHLGTVKRVPVNRAVHSWQILEYLAANQKAIYDLIAPAQVSPASAGER